VLLGVERMARSGRDPSQFARDLLAHLRHLLITQTTGEVPASFVVTATDTERLRAQAGAIGAGALVRTIDELADALTAIREGDEARLAVEIALLKAARPDLDPSTEGLLRRVERLEKGLGTQDQGQPAAGPVGVGDPPPPAVAKASSGVVPPTPPPAAESPPASETEYERPPLEDEPAPAEEDEAEPEAPVASVAVAELDLDELTRVWPSVLDELAKTAPALAATFEGARPVRIGDGGPEIGFPADHAFNKKKAEAPERREAVAAAFEAVVGRSLKPSYVTLEEGEAPPDVPAPGSEEIDEDAILAKVKSEFGAEEVG
jgi:DNA polymerase-3 subunit gamma/tau